MKWMHYYHRGKRGWISNAVVHKDSLSPSQQDCTGSSMWGVPSSDCLLHHNERGFAAQDNHRWDEDQDRAAILISDCVYY